MSAFILIVYLVSGSQNLIWEITGQYSQERCRALLTERIADAVQSRPGSQFVGQCVEVAR